MEIHVSEAELLEYIREIIYPIFRPIIQKCSYLDFLGRIYIAKMMNGCSI